MMKKSTTIGMSILLIQNLMTTTLTVRYSIIAMAGMAIVRVYAFHKLEFKVPPFDGKYDPDAYISLELAVEQKFTCFKFPKNARVRAATSEFSDFASVWWVEYGKKHASDIPQTWITLKWVMQARFVPSYYARDLINKHQQLK
jgi:hypothetical protein